STTAHTPQPEPGWDPAVWEASKALMRAHWGLGSSAVVQTSAPDAGGDLRDWMARHMREAVDPDTAIAMVERFPAIDVTDLLPRVQAPTLVLHRRDDASFPFARGRELAAAIPGARFVSLPGSWHAFYEHEVQDVVLLALAHLHSDGTHAPPADGRVAAADGLSVREVEVLRLLAEGRRNREIAAELSIAENTVFQHVRSILNKTGCANRTEAAAYAHRHGLAAPRTP
ncbi:MAG TPA: response regulator transcription factor, partial [Dehalococcoidia bacterium]|nr:response regulator transcription factor [Dehalococcoidia bacterium]